MMERDRAFLRRRRRIQRRGGELLGICALILVWFSVWLWWRVPLLVNPWMVIEGVRQEKLAVQTLFLMAGLLPLFVLMSLGLLGLLLAVIFGWQRVERRYMELLGGAGE